MDGFLPSLKITAIVTLLTSPNKDQLHGLWLELLRDCNIQLPVTRNPIPHFSWQGADEYNESELGMVLRNTASETEKFNIKTSGIGVFTKPSFVVYISIVKSDELIALHQKVWERTRTLANVINPYYQPESWIPHITIAQGPIDPSTLCCIVNKISFRSFNWNIRVDNLAVIHAGESAQFHPDKQFLFNREEGTT